MLGRRANLVPIRNVEVQERGAVLGPLAARDDRPLAIVLDDHRLDVLDMREPLATDRRADLSIRQVPALQALYEDLAVPHDEARMFDDDRADPARACLAEPDQLLESDEHDDRREPVEQRQIVRQRDGGDERAERDRRDHVVRAHLRERLLADEAEDREDRDIDDRDAQRDVPDARPALEHRPRGSANTYNVPPFCVRRDRSAIALPQPLPADRSRGSSPSDTIEPAQPPTPLYTARYCLPSGPRYVIGCAITPEGSRAFHTSMPVFASTAFSWPSIVP